MTTITITVDGSDYTYDASAEQIAALGAWRSGAMEKLAGDGEPSEREGYIADDVAYLQTAVQARVTQYVDAGDPNETPQAVLDRVMAWLVGADLPAPEQEPLSPEAEKARLIAYLESVNRRANDSEITVDIGGTTVTAWTGDSGRADLSMMVHGANAGMPQEWVEAGQSVSVTVQQLMIIGAAVGAHRKACVAAYSATMVGIVNGSITTTEQIDAADWPG